MPQAESSQSLPAPSTEPPARLPSDEDGWALVVDLVQSWQGVLHFFFLGGGGERGGGRRAGRGGGG